MSKINKHSLVKCKCGINVLLYDNISTGEYIYKCSKLKNNCGFVSVNKYNDNIIKPETKKSDKPVITDKMRSKTLLSYIKHKVKYFKSTKLYSLFQIIESLCKEYNKINKNNKIVLYQLGDDLGNYVEYLLKFCN